MQHAQKGMSSRIDNNPGMSGPYCQVSRLRIGDTEKSGVSRINVRRTRILVREPSSFIGSVNKMGAIITGLNRVFGVHCGMHNPPAFGTSQRTNPVRSLLRSSIFAAVCAPGGFPFSYP